MKTTYERALKAVLASEGGYVNNPNDNGGATNKGVTQRVYDAWRLTQGKPRQSVRVIADDEVAAIYKRQYWDAVHADDLPAGVDFLAFDYAINSGPGRAAKALQAAVGVSADGAIGIRTIAAANAVLPSIIIDRMSDGRLSFMKRLSDWAFFGKGWTRRVAESRATAKALAS